MKVLTVKYPPASMLFDERSGRDALTFRWKNNIRPGDEIWIHAGTGTGTWTDGKIIGRVKVAKIEATGYGDRMMWINDSALLLQPFPLFGTLPGRPGLWKAPEGIDKHAQKYGYWCLRLEMRRLHDIIKRGRTVTADYIDRVYQGGWKYKENEDRLKLYEIGPGGHGFLLHVITGNRILDRRATTTELLSDWDDSGILSLSEKSREVYVVYPKTEG